MIFCKDLIVILRFRFFVNRRDSKEVSELSPNKTKKNYKHFPNNLKSF